MTVSWLGYMCKSLFRCQSRHHGLHFYLQLPNNAKRLHVCARYCLHACQLYKGYKSVDVCSVSGCTCVTNMIRLNPLEGIPQSPFTVEHQCETQMMDNKHEENTDDMKVTEDQTSIITNTNPSINVDSKNIVKDAGAECSGPKSGAASQSNSLVCVKSKKRECNIKNVVVSSDQPNVTEIGPGDTAASENVAAVKKPKVLKQDLLTKVSGFVRENKDKVPRITNKTSLVSMSDADLHMMAAHNETITAAHDQKGDHLSEATDGLFKMSAKQQKKNRKRKRKISQKSNEECFKTNQPKKKNIPNHFVAIQVTNPQIHRRLQMVQDHITSQVPPLKLAEIPLSSLHITIIVMFLADQQDMDRAVEALDCCKQTLSDLELDPLEFNVCGMSTFKDSVVYADIKPGPAKDRLASVAESVTECFTSHSVEITDQRGFTPHLTVLKLSRNARLRYIGIKKISPNLYDELLSEPFGCQTVRSLQLCSMLKPKDNKGYYHVEHQVEFVPALYEEHKDEDELLFSDNNDSKISVSSRQLAREVIIRAMEVLRKEQLAKSRQQKKLEIKKPGKVNHITDDKGKNKKRVRPDDSKLSKFVKEMENKRKPQTFIVELKKKLAWFCEEGQKCDPAEIASIIKKSI